MLWPFTSPTFFPHPDPSFLAHKNKGRRKRHPNRHAMFSFFPLVEKKRGHDRASSKVPSDSQRGAKTKTHKKSKGHVKKSVCSLLFGLLGCAQRAPTTSRFHFHIAYRPFLAHRKPIGYRLFFEATLIFSMPVFCPFESRLGTVDTFCCAHMTFLATFF